MKTMLILTFLFTFMNLIAQVPASWHDKLVTYVPFIGDDDYTERVAIFANHNGIHVLKTIHDDDNNQKKHVKYFRLTSEGTRPEGFPVEGILIDSYGDRPNIVGNENILYNIYRKDNSIQVKYSTNNGDNWLSIPQISFVNGNVNSNGLDAAYTLEKGLHIVWSEKVANNYESYFYRYFEQVWRDFSNITNTTTTQYGGSPTVNTSKFNGQFKAHVSINTGNSDIIGDNHGQNFSRDFDYTNWSNPIAILPQGQTSRIDRLLYTEDGYLHCFYYKDGLPLPNYFYRKKIITSPSWESAEYQIEQYVGDYNMHKIQVSKTSSNTGTITIHAFWMDNGPGFWQRKKYSFDGEWTLPKFNVSEGGVNFRDAAATGNSNDLFSIWSKYGSIGYYEFRHYDDIPNVPNNLFIANTGSPNFHPIISWSIVTEPDVYTNNTDGIKIQRRFYKNDSGSWTSWVPLASLPGNVLNYIDTDIYNASGAGSGYVQYKILSRDIAGHESPFTDPVGIGFGISPQKNSLVQVVMYEYSLFQNYPNPFNPITKIEYSIQSVGFVTLKVYDMLGREVASLVNEYKESGSYSAEFNASNLPSGIYFYTLTSGNFTASKKLILLK